MIQWTRTEALQSNTEVLIHLPDLASLRWRGVVLANGTAPPLGKRDLECRAPGAEELAASAQRVLTPCDF